jgi:hypothetical protein
VTRAVPSLVIDSQQQTDYAKNMPPNGLYIIFPKDDTNQLLGSLSVALFNFAPLIIDDSIFELQSDNGSYILASAKSDRVLREHNGRVTFADLDNLTSNDVGSYHWELKAQSTYVFPLLSKLMK